MITAVKSVRRQVSRDALVTRSHNLEEKNKYGGDSKQQMDERSREKRT